MKSISEFNSKVWSEKKGKGLPLNSEIELPIPEDLAEFGQDLKKMHRIKG